MKKIFIFVLIFLISCTEDEQKPCDPMAVTIPIGAPIKIWVNGELTFNQKHVSGVHTDLFFQPWLCTDELKFQINDTETVVYYAAAVDSTGSILELFQMEPTLAPDGSTFYDLTVIPEDHGLCEKCVRFLFYKSSEILLLNSENWNDRDDIVSVDASIGAVPWVYNGNIGSPFPIPQVYFGTGPYPGTQSQRLDIEYSAFVSPAEVDGDAMLKISTELDFVGDDAGTYEVIFEAWYGPDIIGQVSRVYNIPAGGSSVIEEDEFYIPVTGSFVSNVKVRINHPEETFSVVGFTNIEISNFMGVGRTDPQEISALHADETILITYGGNRPYAGLYYPGVSPLTRFKLRVPALFYHDRAVEVDREQETSGGHVDNISSELKFEVMLRVDLLPDYFHRIILIALKHTYKDIDGTRVTKSQAYEKEETDPHFSGKAAVIWLTEADTVIKGVV